jgi:hypothetical protein
MYFSILYSLAMLLMACWAAPNSATVCSLCCQSLSSCCHCWCDRLIFSSSLRWVNDETLPVIRAKKQTCYIDRLQQYRHLVSDAVLYVKETIVELNALSQLFINPVPQKLKEAKTLIKLKAQDEYFPEMKKKSTQTPTARLIFQCFAGIELLTINEQQTLLLNNKDRQSVIIKISGINYLRIYT